MGTAYVSLELDAVMRGAWKWQLLLAPAVIVLFAGACRESGCDHHVHADEKPPQVLRVDPPLADPGDRVTVYGSRFLKGARVKFGDQKAPETSFVSPEELLAVVPEGLGAVDVTVTNPGGRRGTLRGAFAIGSVARILFPPATSRTEADQITVTGTAADTGGLAAVHVNGQPAFSADGFANWRVVVPLVPGGNTLRVDLMDRNANLSSDAARVNLHVGPALVQPRAMALDVAGNRLLVSDARGRELLAVDLATGDLTEFSGRTRGSGPVVFTVGITLDTENQRVLAGGEGDALLAVNLLTGNRIVVSDETTGDGPRLNGIDGIVVDPRRDRAAIVATSTSSVGLAYLVDLDTGDRTYVGDAPGGTSRPEDLVIDASHDRALGVDSFGEQIFALDLDTLDAWVISGPERGAGPKLQLPRSLDVDEDRGLAWVVDSSWDALLLVDLATGDRQVISGEHRGMGPHLVRPTGIRLDLPGNRAWVVDEGLDAVLSIDLTTGDRKLLTRSWTGTGPDILGGLGVCAYPAAGLNLICDYAVLSVDRVSGDRRIVSGPDRGSGHELMWPREVVVDSLRDRAVVADMDLLVVDLKTGRRRLLDPEFYECIALEAASDRVLACESPELYSIDLKTGHRQLISAEYRGSGPLLSAEGVALDTARDRVLVAGGSPGAVHVVSLTTGDRTVLASETKGAGPVLVRPRSIAYDGARSRALVLHEIPELLAVDLATGDRSTISSSTRGTGPEFGTLFPGVGALYKVAVDEATGTALVVDTTKEALFVVELVSGDRVILSQ
jgi:DNA-binding beta-propeller fold protein YncE